jgi:ribonuclease VapC
LQALYFRARIKEVAFSQEQSIIAIDAYKKYGKGRHPAGLNLGDCCSYALAVHKQMPLRFKGEDFSKSDVLAA